MLGYSGKQQKCLNAVLSNVSDNNLFRKLMVGSYLTVLSLVRSVHHFRLVNLFSGTLLAGSYRLVSAPPIPYFLFRASGSFCFSQCSIFPSQKLPSTLSGSFQEIQALLIVVIISFFPSGTFFLAPPFFFLFDVRFTFLIRFY
ncbi:hypothetical protein CEXT_165791 [Caerostris extrusa]|uniref:Transmembrane protein n=1 Tax=Caerostris extrusa TaxID=172846 RepID=A0AAV4U0T6_CAEEX|nr:hypothetical protein CEXT_165791 [Caerostris extrusa]